MRSLVIGYTGVIHVKRFVRKIKESIICISKHFSRILNWLNRFFNQYLGLSNREFKEKFGHVSGSWRGKNPIQRNAIIALAHFKEESAVPELIEMLENDPRPVIRGTIAWALGRIGLEEGYVAIKEALSKEEDPEVRAELEKAVDTYIY